MFTNRNERIIGACFCGAITFEAITPQWCAYCHCSMCRQIHGAPFVVWVGFGVNDVQVISGEEHVRDYQSSPQAVRRSCELCGSHLFFQSTRWPDELHVTRTSLPDEVDLTPAAHYFYDDRAAWVNITDDLPKFGGVGGTTAL